MPDLYMFRKTVENSRKQKSVPVRAEKNMACILWSMFLEITSTKLLFFTFCIYTPNCTKSIFPINAYPYDLKSMPETMQSTCALETFSNILRQQNLLLGFTYLLYKTSKVWLYKKCLHFEFSIQMLMWQNNTQVLLQY